MSKVPLYGSVLTLEGSVIRLVQGSKTVQNMFWDLK